MAFRLGYTRSSIKGSFVVAAGLTFLGKEDIGFIGNGTNLIRALALLLFVA